MLLTAHQPNYLPYPGFFQKMACADEFLVVDTTQFVKRGPFGWIHRNKIRTANGPVWLSLPVLHKGKYHQRIVDTALNERVNWRHKHWRTIELNYARAPYWQQFESGLRSIYEAQWTHLAPLNTAIIRWFMESLEIDCPVHIASDLASDGKSTDYIVNFSRELGADAFLSGVHGRDYLDTDQFAKAGIELVFQEYTPPKYDAGPDRDPIENLSMLDMLMWCGDQATEWVHSKDEVSA